MILGLGARWRSFILVYTTSFTNYLILHFCPLDNIQHSRLSDGFWAEALLTAVHIINMSPSRPLGLQIPQELWTGSKPNYDKLRIFGCEAYALIPKDDRRKLDPRSRKCFFLGMDPMARSDIDSRTPSTDKSSEVRTWCSTSRLCIKRPKGLLKSEG